MIPNHINQMDATALILAEEGSDEVAEGKPMATSHGKKIVRGLFFAKGIVLLVAAICGINEYRSEKTANGTAEVVEKTNLREEYHLDRSNGALTNTIDLNGAENAITASGINHEDGSDNGNIENFILGGVATYGILRDGVPGKGSAKLQSSTKYNVDLDPTLSPTFAPTLSPTLAPTLSPTLAPALPTSEDIF